MKKGLLLLADGFEESEAITTYDTLLRSKQLEVDLVAIGVNELVTSSHGVKLLAKYTLNAITTSSYDFLILPGGKLGVDNLSSSDLVKKTIEIFHREGKPIFAICAAPSILGELGLLDDKDFTCFPGFQVGKGNYLDNEVAVDGNLITARSMGYSLDFALAIIAHLLSEEVASNVKKGIFGLN